MQLLIGLGFFLVLWTFTPLATSIRAQDVPRAAALTVSVPSVSVGTNVLGALRCGSLPLPC